ncbi:MAG: hypothetical protein L0H96_10435 [Humibacillus sp.]|nr:hypothetical protein [Humibacillus sp.]MDN5777319.1 hypothetical protein [Humibacillus sp.]
MVGIDTMVKNERYRNGQLRRKEGGAAMARLIDLWSRIYEHTTQGGLRYRGCERCGFTHQAMVETCMLPHRHQQRDRLW